MEHYVVGIGAYQKHEDRWGNFLRNRPELQRALSAKMQEIALNICRGSSPSGAVSDQLTGVRLNELASMRMTLHGCERITIEDGYTADNLGTTCCKVTFGC